MKIIKIVTITQVISWGLFLAGDYLSEIYSNDVLLGIIMTFFPFIIPILYLILEKKIHDHRLPKWENVLTVLLLWIAENIVMTILIGNLQIIPQSQNDWENLLNGIEYFIFPILNIVECLFIIICWNFLIFLKKKLNK